MKFWRRGVACLDSRPLWGAIVSFGLTAAMTVGRADRGGLLGAFAVSCLAGALAAAVWPDKRTKEKEGYVLFGRAKEAETVMQDNGYVEIAFSGEEEKQILQPEMRVSGMRDIADALAGIKSLIETLQVTDAETWESVARFSSVAGEALSEARGQLRVAADAADRAAKAIGEIARLVAAKNEDGRD